MKKAFTLIELLVVVLIIGVLAAIALPQYQVAVAKSRMASLLPIIRALKDAQERYYLANGVYVEDITKLDIDVDVFKEASFTPAGFIDLPNGLWIDNLFSVGLDTAAITGGVGARSARQCYYKIWLDRSSNPGIFECIGETDFGKRVCKSAALN